MKILLSIVSVCLVLAVWKMTKLNTALTNQRNEIGALSKKLDAADQSVSLDLQGQCAKQAAESFKYFGDSDDKQADYTNHYNAKLKKCFVLIHRSDLKATPGRVLVGENLVDAFEEKPYGSYVWESDPVKKYWEVSPIDCEVDDFAGEKHWCKSSEEFDTLIKVYMDQ